MNDFDAITHRLRYSPDRLEREHTFLGLSLFGGGPVLLSRRLVGYHGLARGGPGRGKTAFIERLLEQSIRAESPERLAWLEANRMAWEPSSILVVDLKGEPALFHTARLAARRASIPFRYFSFLPDRTSHAFNFFAQSHIDEMSKGHLTQELLQALGAEYGQAYGASFFSSINEVVLLNTLRHACGIDSFRKLDRFLADPNFYSHIPGSVARDLQDARHLTSLARRLSHVHALNVTQADVKDRPEVWKNRIDLPSLMRERQVVYFYLQPLRAETEAATVARLAIFSLITAAAARTARDTHRVLVIVDEFQTMASRGIARVLEHARSMRVPFVLAHQYRTQLKDGLGVDLTETVENCTAWSLDFEASSELDMRRVELLSLRGAYAQPGWSRVAPDVRDFRADDELSLDRAALRDGLETVSVGEAQAPIYDHNTVLELSADPRVAWFRPKLRDGYTQYIGMTPIVWGFHVSDEEHSRLASLPWPAKSADTIVVEKDPFPVKPIPGGPAEPAPPKSQARVEADTTQAIDERIRRLMDGQAPRGGTEPPDAS